MHHRPITIGANLTILLCLCSILVRWHSATALFAGHCTRCNIHHSLPTTEEAKQAAFDLRLRMIDSGRIDVDELKLQFDPDDDDEDLHSELEPSLAIERLYERRGKMFGVLVCNNPSSGDTVILKAYAGKLGGYWNLPGWAPIIGQVPESLPVFCRLRDEVTGLFEVIDATNSNATLIVENGSIQQQQQQQQQQDAIGKVKHLTKERARLATLALDEVRRHQLVTNFRGETHPLTAIYSRGPTKLPGGTGDCAAPKLLAEAARLGLQPTGIAEIFVGTTGGMSTGKGDGMLYDACESRCEQIAGFMLCGLDGV